MLRIVLGVTFTFAGVGYLFGEVGIKGADAAALANLGVAIAPSTPGAKPDGFAPLPSGAPSQRNDRSPPLNDPAGSGASPGEIAKRSENPSGTAEPEPLPAARTEPRRGGKPEPEPQTAAAPKQADLKPVGKPAKSGQTSIPALPVGTLGDTNPAPNPAFAAYQFGQPVALRKVYLTALKIHYAAFPPPRSASATAVMPAFIGAGMVPVYTAHTVAVLELMAGLLLLLGVYCRFWALLTGAIMLGAILIDQIAPALRSGNSTLWVLPGPGPGQAWHELDVYRGLLWQSALATMSFCVVLIGAGAVALDNAQMFSAKGGRPKRGRAAADEDDQD